MSTRTALCDLLGIEHPIVGFTPSEHALAEGFARPGARHSRDTFDVVGGPLAIIVEVAALVR